MNKNYKEDISIKGEVLITLSQLENKEQFEISRLIDEKQKFNEDVSKLILEIKRLCNNQIIYIPNLNPIVGRTMIANNLSASSPDNTMYVNYVALGSGTTAPANANTTLETEVYRNQTASATNADNVAYLTGFFNTTETTGTYEETGLFSNASGTTDSGVLVSRVAIDVTKSDTNTLTIDWTITIS